MIENSTALPLMMENSAALVVFFFFFETQFIWNQVLEFAATDKPHEIY